MDCLYSGYGLGKTIIGEYDDREIFEGWGLGANRIGEYYDGYIYEGIGFGANRMGEYSDGYIYKGYGLGKTIIGEYDDEYIYKGYGVGKTIIGSFDGNPNGAAAASFFLLFDLNDTNSLSTNEITNNNGNSGMNVPADGSIHSDAYLAVYWLSMSSFLIVPGVVFWIVWLFTDIKIWDSGFLAAIILGLLSDGVVAVITSVLLKLIEKNEKKKYEEGLELKRQYEEKFKNISNKEMIESAINNLRDCDINYDELKLRISELEETIKAMVDYNKWYDKTKTNRVFLLLFFVVCTLLDIISSIVIGAYKDFERNGIISNIIEYWSIDDPFKYTKNILPFIILISIVVAILISKRMEKKQYEKIVCNKIDLDTKIDIAGWKRLLKSMK